MKEQCFAGDGQHRSIGRMFLAFGGRARDAEQKQPKAG